METDSELLKKIGSQLGLKNKEHIEKAWMQDKLLYYLSKKRDDLVFKGGTALYKFYSLPRFSEDLDFSTKKNIDEKLVEPFCEAGRIKLSYKRIRDSHLFKLRFAGPLTMHNTIQVDINVTESIFEPETKTYVSHFPEVPPFAVNVMQSDEILAEKIHALLNRTKARDLFDLFFLLKTFEVGKKQKIAIMKKLADRKMKISEKQLVPKIKNKLKDYSGLWKTELKHFVLQELPDFMIVKEFVEKKVEKI